MGTGTGIKLTGGSYREREWGGIFVEGRTPPGPTPFPVGGRNFPRGNPPAGAPKKSLTSGRDACIECDRSPREGAGPVQVFISSFCRLAPGLMATINLPPEV